MDTDTAQLLEKDRLSHQTARSYKRQFPEKDDQLLILVEADTPEQADKLAAQLAKQLKGKREYFRSVYQPGADPFFERNALLYQAPPQLRKLTNHLTAAAPLLARLSQDLSLVQLFETTSQLVERPTPSRKSLDPLLEGINEVVVAELSGETATLSWQHLFQGKDAVSPKPARRLLMVSPRLDFNRLLPASEPMKALDRIVQELQIGGKGYPRIRVTGEVALKHEELQSALQGGQRSGLATLVLVGLLLWVGLRSIRLVIIAVVTLLAGLTLTAGFAAFTVGDLNLISIAFAVLYIGLGIDYAIHFILRYRELRRGDTDNRDALTRTGKEIGGSLTLCALSTSIGFYAFIPTAFTGVSELGLIAGTSMFISLLLSLTLLPALLTGFPARANGVPHGGISPSLLRLAEAPLRHRKGTLLAALGAALVSLALLPRIQFDYNPLNLRSPTSESVVAFQDLISDGSMPSPRPAITLANGAETARKKARRLERLDSVSEARSLFHFVPENQEKKLALVQELASKLHSSLQNGQLERKGYDRKRQLASLRELWSALAARASKKKGEPSLLAQNLDRLIRRLQASRPQVQSRILDRLARGLLRTLPENLGQLTKALNASRVTRSDLPKSLRDQWAASGAIYRVAVYPEEELETAAHLRRFVNDVRKVAPDAAGVPVLNLEAGDAVVSALLKALGLALTGITLIVLFLLREWSATVTVLGPLLLAALITGGATVAMDLPFNFANIIALPLLLGIGVDSGIHMVHRARQALPRHGNLLRTSTARAVVFSTLTSACGFGSLAFSSHPGTASMGQLLTLGVLAILFSTLVVLPALIRGFDPAAIGESRSP